MNSYSVKLKGNFQRTRVDGTAPLYLSVIINGEDKMLPLNLTWPAELIDNKQGIISARKKGDKVYSDYKLIIDNEIHKVNEVFIRYRLADKFLSLKKFLKEHKNHSKRLSFTNFMDFTILDRYESNKEGYKISKQTKCNHTATLGRLREYKPNVAFFEIDCDFLNDFANWLKFEHENEDGTIWARIKDIKAYLALADAEGFGVNPEYEEYENKEPKSRIIFLEDQEINQLVGLYNKKILDATMHITLKAFLFSCFTSLRISDVQLANWGWVNITNSLTFIPHKNQRFNKEVTIPLSKIALALIDKKSGKFFDLPTDQEMNRSLKDIAVKAGIKKNITFHVARHTFGTNFYRETKDVVTLQKIMGHSKIETTMVYVHINEEDKRTGVQKMDDAFMKLMPVMRLVS